LKVSVFLFVLQGVCECADRVDCSPERVSACIKVAGPLLDSDHVFPSSVEDIDHVCNVLFPKTWSGFMACIQEYTSSCLSQDQAADLNRAVGDSINSVHKMCTNEDYKNDYLGHASCLKEKSVNEDYCGGYYTTLMDMVRGDNQASHTQICCTHRSFKECVIAETELCPCDSESGCNGEEATGFARAMLNKALGFLLKQCQTYEQLEGDCEIYRRPQKKQPRVEDTLPNESRYEEGSYFPSGGKSGNGVPSQSQTDLQQAAGNQQDDWTSINQENQSNSAPGSIDSNQGLVESGNNNIDVERPQQETNVLSQLPVNPEPFVPQPGQVELPKVSTRKIATKFDIDIDNLTKCLIFFICINFFDQFIKMDFKL